MIFQDAVGLLAAHIERETFPDSPLRESAVRVMISARSGIKDDSEFIALTNAINDLMSPAIHRSLHA